jgi:phospholipid-binding lipoprotein MlaA
MRLLLLGLIALLGACAHSPVDDPQDPLEPVNRVVYGLNEKLDQYFAQPAARGYTKAVPVPVRIGISNFFDNLTYPSVILNDLLQGKVSQAGRDTGRFLLNSTFGLAGFLDPATMVGLEKNDEDFGQTLGHWGVGQGWFIMLPGLGPATNRDLVGRAAGIYTHPLAYVDSDVGIPAGAVDLLDSRARLLGTETVLAQQFDRYAFIRGIYLQRRQFLVYDGNPPKEDFDDYEDDE